MVSIGQILTVFPILENVGLVTKIKILGVLQPELLVKLQQVVAILENGCHGYLGTHQRWH